MRNRNQQRVNGWGWLRFLNLRPEESERTFLMFASYTLTSVGILWFEVSVAALFLGEYGAESLPWIYLASAGMGTGLGFIYSWLQRVLPLHRVLVVSSVLVALPLLLFWAGMNPVLLGGIVVFLMRLWLEAIYAVNELNTTIAANQLFTIWEIKRTYPFVSSGILVADVLSGFSLPILRSWVGLPNVILLSCLMLLMGAGILYYVTRIYRQAFPDFSRRRFREKSPDYSTRIQGSVRQYVVLVFAFFIMLQVLALLLDFQYLNQLEQRPNVSVDDIADFLAVFSAILGAFELLTQWFISGRAIRRLGVFGIAILPPAFITGLSVITLSGAITLFAGIIVLKFLDELLRYTLVASTGPILFHPIPDASRSRIQSIVRGIAEPLSTGVTGVVMLITLWLIEHTRAGSIANSQSLIFLSYTALFSLFWLFAVLMLRTKYVEVLVLSAERGQLTQVSEMDLPVLRRNIAETLNRTTSSRDAISRFEEEQKSCIEMLSQTDPKNAAEVLAPLLSRLPPARQHQSLEAMLKHPNPAYLEQVRSLISQPLPPEVYAVALRYIWLTEPNPDMNQLRDYLKPEVDPVIRGTAASLMLRRGDPQQKAEATETLRRMLTHKRERERVMGCRALGEADYLQSLRLYIEPRLQDESLRVRCAMLEAIAATHSEAYYPALLKGLYYKSTRDAARHALERLENEAIPLLLNLAEDPYKPEVVRATAWMTIGQIGTAEALEILVTRLTTAWGWNRHVLLRTLMKLPPETAVSVVEQLIGRSGVEALIDQELQFLAHMYASLLDLDPELANSEAANLLRRALRDSEADAIERLFMLMRLMYDSNKIQAAAFNWRSESRDNLGRGLEILDNTLDLHHKQALLSILDRQADSEKLNSLADICPYTPFSPNQRLRFLVDLRHFLSDWALACCFHLARQMHWSLTSDQVLACLRYPTGFVREAVLAYLQTASPTTLQDLLPLLKDDPNPLVASQVRELMTEGIRGKR
ncbi:MFS transporter [Phormidium tenue FACHB-886]|nr:MFS transporter [Phormidium tenue FACHB-886]